MTENEIIDKHKKLFDPAAALIFYLYHDIRGKHKKEFLNQEVIIAFTGKPSPFPITLFEFWDAKGYYNNILKVCILNLGSVVESFFKEYLPFKFPNKTFSRGFFQRLDEFDGELGTAFLDHPEFQRLKDFMQIRHIYQHVDGMVDKSFLDKFKRHQNYKEGDLYLLEEKEVSEDYTNFRSFLNLLLP